MRNATHTYQRDAKLREDICHIKNQQHVNVQNIQGVIYVNEKENPGENWKPIKNTQTITEGYVQMGIKIPNDQNKTTMRDHSTDIVNTSQSWEASGDKETFCRTLPVLQDTWIFKNIQ